MLPSIPHRIKWPLVFIALWLGLLMTVWPQVGRSQAVRSPDALSRVLVIEKLSVQDGVVSGEVHNLFIPDRARCPAVRPSHLAIGRRTPPRQDRPRYVATFHTLQQEIPPGGTARFNFTQSPPLAKTAGGHFVTTVSIAGFTEVIPQVR